MEDNLQRVVNKFNHCTVQNKLTVSINEKNIMAFGGKIPVRTNIVINSTILDLASQEDAILTYQFNEDIKKYINSFKEFVVHFREKTEEKESGLKLYKFVEVTTLLCGSEVWVVSKNGWAAEMKFERDVWKNVTDTAGLEVMCYWESFDIQELKNEDYNELTIYRGWKRKDYLRKKF